MELNRPDFSDAKLHQFADQVEVFLAFFHTDLSLSKSDLQSLVDKDVDSVQGATDDAIENIYDTHGSESAEMDIVIEGKAVSCLSYIQGRSERYGDFYPFSLLDDERVSRPNVFTEKQKLYLFLLQCSTLNLIDKKSDSIMLANSFESVCSRSLKEWLPQAEVKEFGPTSVDRKNYFGQNTRDALLALSEFINATPIKENILRKRVGGDFQVNSSGDKGLDLVAKLPFVGDTSLGAFSIFGQCASRKDHWWHKKHEADPVELKAYMMFNNTPVNMVFIPVCFRDSDGSWYDEGKAGGGCIVVDRLRICTMFKAYEGDYAFLPVLASAA